MRDERVFLGWALNRAHGPLTHPHGRHTAAVWPWRTVPMAMVVGSTGGGKTTLLRGAATTLIKTPAPPALVLADGKGANSFMMFAGLDGVEVCNGPRDVADAVQGVHDTLTQRLTQLDQARQRAAATRGPAGYLPPRPLHFWLDEYIAWVLDLNPNDRKQAISQLTRVGLLGREVGIHLLLAMQRPDAKAIDTGLPGSLKAQLKLRVAATGLMGMDGLEARMCFDDTNANPPAILGGGLVRAGRHEVPFKVPFVADPTSPETTAGDRAAAWRRLPDPVEIRP